ncbi:opticin [Triplophysa rosa]|uniref:Opticin n=1 Tax=Triplophysa rosa TaxID=992332 RepID=A0A9W7TFC9_TRIRA|nr:opticin [Triplophysa rosa]XP_057218303.1 opticin [Triplophysa rosa]KAI7795052.1 opticin precursor [Triplophysa rosa]
MALFHTFLVLTLVGFSVSALPVDSAAYDLENYDVDSDTWDLNTYGETYDYDDLDEEIVVGTLAPPPPVTQPPAIVLPPDYVEEVTLLPRPTKSPSPSTLHFRAPGLFGPDTGLGLPTCLLCVCVSGSVYCDDSELTQIPPLPKDTTHFYARFNKITEVKAKDFINLNQLQRIDLSGNQISRVDEDAFRSLSQLQDLFWADNNIQALPELPASLKHIDVRNNQLRSAGMHAEAFKEMKELQFLYLSNNKLDYVPVPLPETLRVLHLQNNNIQSINQDTFCNSHDMSYIRKSLEDIRLDGNPVDINLYAQTFVCLPRLPVGTPV